MTTEEIAAALQALVDAAKARGIKEPAALHIHRSPGRLEPHAFALDWPSGYEAGFGATPAEALAKLRVALTKIGDLRAKELAHLEARASALGYSLTACDPAASAA